MALNKSQKEKIVEGLKENVAKQKVMLFVDVKGLKVKDLSVLKKNLKSVDAKLQVVKKTLLELVYGEAKIGLKAKELSGQTALIFGFGDWIAPAKVVYEFSQKNSLSILGGYLEGETRSRDEVIILAKLPTRTELLARIVGSIAAPLSGFVSVLENNIKGLIVALDAMQQKKK